MFFKITVPPFLNFASAAVTHVKILHKILESTLECCMTRKNVI